MKTFARACAFLLLVQAGILGAANSELDKLQGKWSMQRTNEEGRVYSQTLEFAGDKLTFELRDGEGEVRLTAKANVKTQKAGPLNIFTLFDIEGGRSAAELESVSDQRTSVFTLRDGKLIIASNFDRERERERPSVDTYTRAEATRSTTARPEAGVDKLVGTWEMELTVGGNTIDYELVIENTDGQLRATLVSPRSGKHKFKSIEYTGGQLKMEIDREIQGQDTTLVYTGKLMGNTLSGKVTAPGLGEGAATWEATR